MCQLVGRVSFVARCTGLLNIASTIVATHALLRYLLCSWVAAVYAMTFVALPSFDEAAFVAGRLYVLM